MSLIGDMDLGKDFSTIYFLTPSAMFEKVTQIWSKTGSMT